MMFSSLFFGLLLFIGAGKSKFISREPKTFELRLKEARRILSENPLIDGHNDLGVGLHGVVNNEYRVFPFDENSTLFENYASETYHNKDLPDLIEGLVAAQLWDVWVPCNVGKMNGVLQALKQIDTMKSIIEDNSDTIQFAETAEDIFDNFVDEKISVLIGIEGGHILNSSLAILRTLYESGARFMTLTHICSTPWAESAHDKTDDHGLSHYGQLVVDEMNRLGMIIDLSHASEDTIRDVYERSAAPVMFSHSSVYALCDDPRNIRDDALKDLASNDGIIMVNLSPEVISCSDNASIHDIIDHINYIKNITGFRHVGLGSDYRRHEKSAEGLENLSHYPNLFAELLLDPEWTEENLKLLAGFNFLRVFHTVESVKDFLEPEAPVENIVLKHEEDEGIHL